VHEKRSGLFVGSFAVIPVEQSDDMQMGYALLPEHWGKGYATELTKAGIEYVFSETPLNIIYGYTEKPNTPSQKVLLKCGFHFSAEKREAGRDIVEFMLEKKAHFMQKEVQSNSRIQ
jgi:ribosomal-protein-alanine N-acetyltransferase